MMSDDHALFAGRARPYVIPVVFGAVAPLLRTPQGIQHCFNESFFTIGIDDAPATEQRWLLFTGSLNADTGKPTSR